MSEVNLKKTQWALKVRIVCLYKVPTYGNMDETETYCNADETFSVEFVYHDKEMALFISQQINNFGLLCLLKAPEENRNNQNKMQSSHIHVRARSGQSINIHSLANQSIFHPKLVSLKVGFVE
ncbi:hypothetical protein Fot_30269 [Forsythia ovata]|uniref:Uncharacterized protein n=1 Tax=Forsythia ovata TaxID=205694 RepID=A0ABD1TU86_9LAMI